MASRVGPLRVRWVVLAAFALPLGCRDDDPPWPDVYTDYNGRARLPDAHLSDVRIPEAGDADDAADVHALHDAFDAGPDDSGENGSLDAALDVQPDALADVAPDSPDDADSE